jgi:tetratricopeptide (TPR) repeat protein
MLSRSYVPVQDTRWQSVGAARQAVHLAAQAAVDDAMCRPGVTGIDAAAEALTFADFDRAQRCAVTGLTGEPGRADAVRAHVIAGQASLHLGQPAAAARHLAAAIDGLTPDDPLRPVVTVWLAAAAVEASDCQLAMRLVRELGSVASPLPLEHELRFIGVRAELACAEDPSQSEAAATRARTLLDAYPEYPRSDELRVEVGRSLTRTNARRQAVRWLDGLDWDRPFDPAAAVARQLLAAPPLDAEPRPSRTYEQRLDRGVELRRARHWATAEQVLTELQADLAARVPDSALLGRTRFQLAVNAYDSGDYRLSLSRFEALRSPVATGVDLQDVLLWLAKSLSRLDRGDEALQTYEAAYASATPAVRARELATFAWDIGRYDEALRLRKSLVLERDHGSFDFAFLQYLAGEYEPALATFTRLAAASGRDGRGRLLYWVGRTKQRLGDIEGAVVAYRSIETSTYYRILAESRLEELAPSGSSELPRTASRALVYWQGSDALLGSSFSTAIGAPADPWTPGPAEDAVPWSSARTALQAFADRHGELFSSARLASRLFEVGAIEESRVAVRDVALEMLLLDRAFAGGRTSSLRRPIRLEARRWAHLIDNRSVERGFWGVALREPRFPVPAGRAQLERYVARHEAIRSRRGDIIRSLAAPLRAVDDFHMLKEFIGLGHFRGTSLAGATDRTPRPYGRELDRCARETDLNPYFVWSIMNVESDLNPDSISYADAYGLLQVIPKTGDLMALRFGDGAFGIHDLITPRDAVHYGCHYLAELVKKFRGQELLAAAAYNAGPHQVARWIDWRGHELGLDEFIETIPFAATRLYPQKTLGFMARYRDRYGPSKPLYVGNLIDPDYLSNIHF